MQVIGQDDDRIDRERSFAPGHAKGRTQSDNVVDEHGRASVRERDGEKEGAAKNEVSSVPDHVPRLPRISLRSIRATISSRAD